VKVLSAAYLIVNATVFYSFIIPVHGYAIFTVKTLYVFEIVFYDALAIVNLISTVLFWGLVMYLLTHDPVGKSVPKKELPGYNYCEQCDLSYPGKARHHCWYCHKCVVGFDHHCFYINQCVGSSNYRAWHTWIWAFNIMLISQVCITGFAVTDALMDREQSMEVEDTIGVALFSILSFTLMFSALIVWVVLMQLCLIHLTLWRLRRRTGRFMTAYNWYGNTFENERRSV